MRDRVTIPRPPFALGIIAALAFLGLVLLLTLGDCQAANAKGRDKLEQYYQQQWCQSHGGYIPVKALSDGTFPDCLTKTHAVEVDFGKKWGEAVGQALNYARLTGLKPGIVLIVEREADWRALRRILEIGAHYPCLGLDVWTVEAESAPAGKGETEAFDGRAASLNVLKEMRRNAWDDMKKANDIRGLYEARQWMERTAGEFGYQNDPVVKQAIDDFFGPAGWPGQEGR